MTIAGRRSPKAYREETEAQAQRFAVLERDEFSCRFEIAVTGLLENETHRDGSRILEWDGDVAWSRCGSSKDLQTAHVFRRWKCGEHETDDGIPLKWHPLVAIAGCRTCHFRFDHHVAGVRAPADAVEDATALIEHTLATAKASLQGVAHVDLTHT